MMENLEKVNSKLQSDIYKGHGMFEGVFGCWSSDRGTAFKQPKAIELTETCTGKRNFEEVNSQLLRKR